jgi:hypothetical protein
MATLLKVDDSEISIEPGDPHRGLEPDELFSLIGYTARLVWLTTESAMIRNEMSTALRNYRATKLLQFFTERQYDEVRGSALLVNRMELSLDGLMLVTLAEIEIRIR